MHGHFQTGSTRSASICRGVGSHCDPVVHPNFGSRTAALGVFLSAADCLSRDPLRQFSRHADGIAATLCAAFFLYDPLYSFYVASPLDVGELVCFVGLALIGAKCAADLLQPLVALPEQNPAAED